MCFPIANSVATPPKSLLADEKWVRVKTDFRQWLAFWRVMTAHDLTIFEKQNVALLNTFGFIPKDVEGAMEEAILFFLRNGEPARELPRDRVLDWEIDWLCIWADFRLYAGLDLDHASLHWWRFMALFESLPKDSGIKRRISIRALDLGEIKDGKLRDEYRRMKEAVALDPVEEDWEEFYKRAAD